MIMPVLFNKLLGSFIFQLRHSPLIILTILFQNMFDLGDRDNREEFGEQEITGKEQPECSQVKTSFPDSRCIISTPCTGQVLTIHRCDDDHETFEPHTDVYKDRHKKSDQQVPSHFFEPEDLWRQHITSHYDPVAPAIRTVQVKPVFKEGEILIFNGRIPGHE